MIAAVLYGLPSRCKGKKRSASVNSLPSRILECKEKGVREGWRKSYS